MLGFPLIVLNFKVYLEAIGENGIRLARYAEEVSKEYGVSIAVAPPVTMLSKVIHAVGIPVFSQHVDPSPPGSWTGSVIVEMIKECGVAGSLVNHSEKRMLLADISTIIKRLRESNLITLLCTDTIETTKAGAALSPDIIAIEPPELIGTGISVSKAKPEIVAGAVDVVRKINPSVHILCGAGISTGEDVAKAIELGTEGVLLASAYVKAKDPRRLLSDMAQAALKAWEAR
ncbi:MAG: triose-phosphate isomerase [Nitrososphaerota archaeon]